MMTDKKDISEQERIAEEHRRNEAMWRSVVGNAPVFVVILDHADKVQFVNHAAPGMTVEEAIGKSVYDFLQPEYVATARESFARVRRTGETAFYENVGTLAENIPVLRKHGSVFYADITTSRILYNGRPCVIGFFRDVTERQRAQDALHRMLQASDRDRELFTFELHDGVAQQQLGALMQFEAYEKLKCHETEAAQATFEGGLTALREASAEARSLMNRTNTPVLARFGVPATIADLIDEFDRRPNAPDITYRCEANFHRLEPALENAIFRVTQEAIANACIHSKSHIVRVAILQGVDDVTVEVWDAGIGFDMSSAKEHHFGLHGIRARTRLLGKGLEIESSPGQGTLIRATFPLIYRDEQAE